MSADESPPVFVASADGSFDISGEPQPPPTSRFRGRRRAVPAPQSSPANRLPARDAAGPAPQTALADLALSGLACLLFVNGRATLGLGLVLLLVLKRVALLVGGR